MPPAILQLMRALVVAVVAAALYVWLGSAVAHAPPRGIDLAGKALAGEAPALALVLTASCWWTALVVLGLVAVVVAARSPAWRGRVLFALPTTLVTWQVSDALKNLFSRPRPEYWIRIQEPSYAYSSGHAMFAVLVYGLWASFIWRSSLRRPVRVVVAPALVLWAGGVIWSRLALGAHYVTDLAGGVLLAVTALGVGSAVAAAVRARAPAP